MNKWLNRIGLGALLGGDHVSLYIRRGHRDPVLYVRVLRSDSLSKPSLADRIPFFNSYRRSEPSSSHGFAFALAEDESAG